MEKHTLQNITCFFLKKVNDLIMNDLQSAFLRKKPFTHPKAVTLTKKKRNFVL